MTYIITETCVACGTCISECPVDAISEGQPYVVNDQTCVDCGQCADICPVDAIYRKM